MNPCTPCVEGRHEQCASPNCSCLLAAPQVRIGHGMYADQLHKTLHAVPLEIARALGIPHPTEEQLEDIEIAALETLSDIYGPLPVVDVPYSNEIQ